MFIWFVLADITGVNLRAELGFTIDAKTVWLYLYSLRNYTNSIHFVQKYNPLYKFPC